MEGAPPDYEAQLAKVRRRVDELEQLIVHLHPELQESGGEDDAAAGGRPVLRVIRGGLAAFSGEPATTSRWRRTLAGLRKHSVRFAGAAAASAAALAATTMLIVLGGPSIPAPAPGGQNTVPLPAIGQGHHRRRLTPRPAPSQPRASRAAPARLSARCLYAGPAGRSCRMLSLGAEAHGGGLARKAILGDTDAIAWPAKIGCHVDRRADVRSL